MRYGRIHRQRKVPRDVPRRVQARDGGPPVAYEVVPGIGGGRRNAARDNSGKGQGWDNGGIVPQVPGGGVRGGRKGDRGGRARSHADTDGDREGEVEGVRGREIRARLVAQGERLRKGRGVPRLLRQA